MVSGHRDALSKKASFYKIMWRIEEDSPQTGKGAGPMNAKSERKRQKLNKMPTASHIAPYGNSSTGAVKSVS